MVAKSLPPHEYLLQCFSYDPETGVLTWRERPRTHFSTDRSYSSLNSRFARKRAGSERKHPHNGDAYRTVKIDGKFYKEHRVIWKLITGRDPELEIDHMNGNGIDNRWQNLREATGAQNCANKPCPARDLPRGVYMRVSDYTGRVTFRAIIGVKHRLVSAGEFKSVDDAAAARWRAERALHGEFAFNATRHKDPA